MAQLYIAASRRAYADLIPDRALDAIDLDERARRWAESLATAGPDETILVGASEDRIAGLGHCGPQRVISEGPVVAPSPIAWAPGNPYHEKRRSPRLHCLASNRLPRTLSCRRSGRNGF